jgi:hypothetical protein
MRFVLKIGAGSSSEGPVTVYALLEKLELIELYTASSDADAVARAIELSAGAGVELEDALEPAAAAAGRPVRRPTAGEAATRVELAVRVFARASFGAVAPHALLDYFETAYAFWQVSRRETKHRDLVVDLRGAIGGAQVDERRGIVVSLGERPSLATMSEADLERVLAGTPVTQVDRLAVTFGEDPPALAQALERPYGLKLVPLPLLVEGGRSGVVSDLLITKLATIMALLARHFGAGSMGVAWDAGIGGTVEARLTHRGIGG